MPMSPAAAAKYAKVSRPLISKAIKDGELIATRKNNRYLSIEQSDLDDWMSRRTQVAREEPAPAEAKREPVTSHDQEKIDALTAELAELRSALSGTMQSLARAEGAAAVTAERIADLGKRIESVSADRDEWRKQADKLAEQLAEASKPQPGLLARLFGR